jgi:periplasmic copper chaperone A
MRSSTLSSADLRGWPLAAAAVVAFTLVACGQPAQRVDLQISDPWVRASMTTENPTAGYMTITNRGNVDETLIAAAVEGADRVELHRSTSDGSGMHQMEPVDSIAIPAGATVKLEPGGLHLMIFGLAEPLEVGDEVLVTLTFAEMSPQAVLADVRSP